MVCVSCIGMTFDAHDAGLGGDELCAAEKGGVCECVCVLSKLLSYCVFGAGASLLIAILFLILDPEVGGPVPQQHPVTRIPASRHPPSRATVRTLRLTKLWRSSELLTEDARHGNGVQLQFEVQLYFYCALRSVTL